MAKTKTFSNIVIRMPNHIGDCVMATPVISDLIAHYPKAKITIMCKKNIVPMFENDKRVDAVLGFTKPKHPNRKQEQKQLIADLKEKKFDLGVLLPNSFSSAFLFWKAGVKNRLGYSRDGRRFFLNIPVKPKASWQSYHFVDQYKMILNGLGIRRSRTKPELFISENDLTRAKEILQEHHIEQRHKVVGINPSAASGTAKIWPKERFKLLVEKLSQIENVKVILFGDQYSKSVCDEICENGNENVVNLAAKTNLQEAIAIIKLCDVMVSNDSGPMHIAAAIQTPVVGIFGPTNDLMSGPFTPLCHIIHKHVACSPCHLGECPIDHRCMLQIQVDEVFEKVTRWLNLPKETLKGLQQVNIISIEG